MEPMVYARSRSRRSVPARVALPASLAATAMLVGMPAHAQDHGPREFRDPGDLVILPGDTIQIRDGLDRVHFTAQGTLPGAKRAMREPSPNSGKPLAASSG